MQALLDVPRAATNLVFCDGKGDLARSQLYLGFGGFGLTTPVVSYAPRPMFIESISRVTIEEDGRILESCSRSISLFDVM